MPRTSIMLLYVSLHYCRIITEKIMVYRHQKLPKAMADKGKLSKPPINKFAQSVGKTPTPKDAVPCEDAT